MVDDRYIPKRSMLNFEAAFSFISREKHVTKKRNNYLETDYQQLWRQKAFKIIFEKSISGRLDRVFSFSQSPKSSSYEKKCLRSRFNIIWPVILRKKPLLWKCYSAFSIPDILHEQNHSNLLDWSNSDYFTACLGDTLYLWYVPTKDDSVYHIPFGPNKGSALCWDPMGENLTVITFANEIFVFNTTAMKLVYITKIKPCSNECVVCSLISDEDGQYIISGCTNGEITVYNSKNLKVVTQVTAHEGPVKLLKFNSNYKYLASLGNDHVIVLWMFPTMQGNWMICHGNVVPNTMAWHPWHESLLAIGREDGRVTLWDTRKNKKFCDIHSAPSNLVVDCLSFSPRTGELLVSYWSPDALWNQARVVIFESPDSPIGALCPQIDRNTHILWSPDGRKLAIVCVDDSLSIFHCNEGKKIEEDTFKRKIRNFEKFGKSLLLDSSKISQIYI